MLLGREIEGLDRTPIRDVVQTDAAINPGNSGGPLLDSRGRLIGVNTQIYSPSGASAGIGFSIPVDTVSWVVPDLIEHGRVIRPVLGIETDPGSAAARADSPRASSSATSRRSLAPKTPAFAASTRTDSGRWQIGDIILADRRREGEQHTGAAPGSRELRRRRRGHRKHPAATPNRNRQSKVRLGDMR